MDQGESEVVIKPGMRVKVSANAIPYEDGENYQGREGTTVREERTAWWVLLDGETQEQWFGPSELEIVIQREER